MTSIVETSPRRFVRARWQIRIAELGVVEASATTETDGAFDNLRRDVRLKN